MFWQSRSPKSLRVGLGRRTPGDEEKKGRKEGIKEGRKEERRLR